MFRWLTIIIVLLCVDIKCRHIWEEPWRIGHWVLRKCRRKAMEVSDQHVWERKCVSRKRREISYVVWSEQILSSIQYSLEPEKHNVRIPLRFVKWDFLLSGRIKFWASFILKTWKDVMIVLFLYQIRFYVDDIPIREVMRNEGMRGDYPAKPMSVYATIWDASAWATNGGKEKVDYQYEPFVAEFNDLVLEGCIVDPTEQIQSTNCTDRIATLNTKEYSTITPNGRQSMKWFRERYMYYSYCYDNIRYPVPPPECVILPSEKDMFMTTGRLREKMKFSGSNRRHRRGRTNRRRNKGSSQQAADMKWVYRSH